MGSGGLAGLDGGDRLLGPQQGLRDGRGIQPVLVLSPRDGANLCRPNPIRDHLLKVVEDGGGEHILVRIPVGVGPLEEPHMANGFEVDALAEVLGTVATHFVHDLHKGELELPESNASLAGNGDQKLHARHRIPTFFSMLSRLLAHDESRLRSQLLLKTDYNIAQFTVFVNLNAFSIIKKRPLVLEEAL